MATKAKGRSSVLPVEAHQQFATLGDVKTAFEVALKYNDDGLSFIVGRQLIPLMERVAWLELPLYRRAWIRAKRWAARTQARIVGAWPALLPKSRPTEECDG